MKWIQDRTGEVCLEAEWLRENERITQTDFGIAIIIEYAFNVAVSDPNDEAAIRSLVESLR